MSAAKDPVVYGEEILRALFDNAPDAVIVVDAGGSIVAANPQSARLFGYAIDELVGQPVEVLLPARSQAAHRSHRQRFAGAPASRTMGAGLDLSARRRDGTEFPVDVSLSPVVTSAGSVVVADVRDMTERRRSEQAARQAEQRFRRVFDDAPIGMALITQDERLNEVNQALCDLVALSAADLEQRSLSELTPLEDAARSSEVLADLFAGMKQQAAIEKRLVSGDGRARWARVTFSALHDLDAGETRVLAMIEDITDRKESEVRLAHLASHDELTGLANRTRLIERLTDTQTRSVRTRHFYAVLFIDLDDFKDTNDTLGHHVGDAVLVEIGRRIRGIVRPSDTAARHGGDEFVVCCEDIGTLDAEARKAALALAERLRASLATPVAVDGQPITLTASVGVAIACGDDRTPHALIAAADAAMYQAKRTGTGIAWADATA